MFASDRTDGRDVTRIYVMTITSVNGRLWTDIISPTSTHDRDRQMEHGTE
jgi:hypothetical protein